MLYIVIEIQSNGATCSTIPWSFTTEQAAQAKYFAVCSAAVASSVPIHTVVIMTDSGEFQGLEEKKKERYIKKIYEKGVSIRQIGRLTGISKGLIEKHLKA